LSRRHAKPSVIRGEVGNPIEPKPGCRFAPRCEYVSEKCTGEDIPLVEISSNHFVSCVLT
ncbi:MAG: peptide ABC transporter substrate-binding protein, partial [Synergistaceae bacterium]|nr:peptide ABC transporter substrate-binding protein [Synergistaceae bacterium]